MPLFEPHPPGLKDFVRVRHTPEFIKIFDYLFSKQNEVLYNHSRIFPFAYLNKGRMKLFINKDFQEGKIIPVVQQFESRLEGKWDIGLPQFNLFTPYAFIDDILKVASILKPHSSVPVEIIDVTEGYAGYFCKETGWKKTKTNDDIIQTADLLSSRQGRAWSSLRNTLKHVRNDLKPVTRLLEKDNYKDALTVFNEWKEIQGAKYFRVTIGRDIRLIEEYYDKMDFENFFSFILYVDDKPVAASFGCKSSKDPQWGVDVTCKANINYKGMGDFAFIHLMEEMHKKGIIYVNDSGGTGKVLLNKKKFNPIKTIPMFSLKRV